MAESCRKAVKDRILNDMLGRVQDGTGGGWRVLVLDEFTTRILSSSMRLSDVLDCNVSVVEDLGKVREPLHQPAIYFIQPTPKSVARLMEDFGGPEGTDPVPGGGKGPNTIKALYPTAHIFFSAKAPAEVVERIKGHERLMKCLKNLFELNLEFLTVDSRTMVTDHPKAAELLLSDACETDRNTVTRQVDSICGRLVTLFAALNEFPVIRYKAARAVEPGDPPGQQMRGSLPQLLATRLIERLSTMQRAGQLPPRESCDLLVLDRAYDTVAPFIHDWGYEALAHDLLDPQNQLEGNVYRYESEIGGKAEAREAVLDERDELWVELRHLFIAEVYATLAQRFKEFQSKNKAARAGGALKDKDMSASNLRQLIVALPQYRDVLSRLAMHISLSSELKAATTAGGLTEVGELEQDLVLGEKTSKEMMAFLTERAPRMDVYDKLRLLACYLATHPGKLDAAKRSSWQKSVGLTPEDMAALCGGLARMGVQVMEGAAPADGKSGLFGRAKGAAKPVKATRSAQGGDDEEQYALNRFAPLMLDIGKALAAGKLSLDEYPYVRPPSDGDPAATASAAAQSARTGRGGLNWAKKKEGDPSGSGQVGRRLVVFVLGGITRGEMRVAHQLAATLGRDVVLGSTSVERPQAFVDLLYRVIPHE